MFTMDQVMNCDWVYLLGEFQSYSALSSQKPLTYPKLDIRNFYLEKQSDMSHDVQKWNKEKKESTGMRIFSYIAHLKNTIKKESELLVNPFNYNAVLSNRSSFRGGSNTIDQNVLSLGLEIEINSSNDRKIISKK